MITRFNITFGSDDPTPAVPALGAGFYLRRRRWIMACGILLVLLVR